MRVIWSPQSMEDRKQVYAFISEYDSEAADAMDTLFETQAQRLLVYPELGRVGRVVGTRELVVHKHYVLVYVQRTNFIGIAALLHTSRQYPN